MSTRRIFSRIHAIAGTLAFAIILSFLSASLLAECLGGPALIARVKETIAWSLLALVPALAATGGTGFAMVGRPSRGVLLTKFRRMQFVAANGMLVLVPSALFLAWKAGQGAFDAAFVAVQLAEFAAGYRQPRADGAQHPRRPAHVRPAAARRHEARRSRPDLFQPLGDERAAFVDVDRVERAGAEILEFVRHARRHHQDLAGPAPRSCGRPP